MTRLVIEWSGVPVAAARTNSGNGRHYTPEKYRTYKNDLIYHFSKYAGWYEKFIPEGLSPNKRKNFIKDQRWKCSVIIRIPKNVGDRDNYEKGIYDALQQARVISNDKHINEGMEPLYVEINRRNPGISLILEPGQLRVVD